MIGTIAPPGVTRRLLGGVTTAAVPVGATAIPLDLASDFNAQSGGVLRSEDAGDLVYTSHDNDALILAEPLAVELQADSPVDALDAEGNVQEEWTVAVDLGEDDPETCYIGTDLQGDFTEGEEQVDQSVEVVERDGRYWIARRVDQPRALDPDAIASTVLNLNLWIDANLNISTGTTTSVPLVYRRGRDDFAPNIPPREWWSFPRSGWWRFELFAEWEAEAVGGRTLYLQHRYTNRDGVVITSTLRSAVTAPAENGFATSHFSETLPVYAEDEVRMAVRQSSGRSLVVAAGLTTMSATYVGPLTGEAT